LICIILIIVCVLKRDKITPNNVVQFGVILVKMVDVVTMLLNSGGCALLCCHINMISR